MKNKNTLRILTFLLSFVFIISSFLLTAYAGELNDYKVHNSGIFGFGGKWEYQKNDDGKNTITLVKCDYDKEVNLTSPIDNHDITRIGKNFSFVKHVVDHTESIGHYVLLVLGTILIIPAPLVWFMEGITLANKNCHSIWECYAKHYDIYSNIISVDLPKCIAVEEGGFKNNYNLKAVNLPSCEKIGPNAFLDNFKLENINLSKNYDTVENGTFEGCFSLKDFKNSDVIKKLGNRSFSRTGLEKLNLKSCESIGDRCFADCKNLKNVKLSLCKSIGECAFEGCTSLEDIDIPSCEEIRPFVFKNCHSINNGLKISNNVQKIGCYAFENCLNLEKMSLDKCETIDEGAFKSCGKLKSLSFLNCKSIGKNVFEGCKNLKNVKLSLCKSIGECAFEGCTSLEDIDIPSCEEIRPFVFKNCHSINNGLKISNNVQKIGCYAFENCLNLEKMSLDKCETIDEGAFKNCGKLKSLSFLNCKSIGKNVFEGCKNLTDVASDKCENISSEAFKNCSNLETVYFPNCKKVEANAFNGCDSLRKLVVSKDCKFEENSISIQKILEGTIEFFDKNKFQND